MDSQIPVTSGVDKIATRHLGVAVQLGPCGAIAGHVVGLGTHYPPAGAYTTRYVFPSSRYPRPQLHVPAPKTLPGIKRSPATTGRGRYMLAKTRGPWVGGGREG